MIEKMFILMLILAFLLIFNIGNEITDRIEPAGYIYIIRNIINGKVYIGQTIQDPKRRWIQHKSAARSGEISPLYNSMRFHGIDKFIFEIIDEIPFSILNEKEMEYIREYRSNIQEYGNQYGYNQNAGGIGMTPKYIKQTLLKELIILGYSRDQICQELGVARSALDTRIHQFWGGTLRDMRKQLMKPFVKSLIIEGYNLTKIAERLNKSRDFVYGLLDKFLGVKTLFEARQKLRRPIIKDLLQKGFLLNEIANKLNVSRATAATYIHDYWRMTYTKAKDYFMKPFIKSLIEKGLKEQEITQELRYVDYINVNRKIHEYWNMNYRQARDLFFIKPLLETMMQDEYTRDEAAFELAVRPETVDGYSRRFWGLPYEEAKRRFF